MTSLNISVHSFVDLITNSSSETFICSTANTILAVRSFIDALLKADGSPARCDDLFTITLSDLVETYDDDGQDASVVRQGISTLKVEAKKPGFAEAAKTLEKLQATFSTREVYD